MAGLKLVMCLALIAPALSQVYNGQQSQQRQQRFNMRQFAMGRAAGMTEMGEFMDTRSDMISDAIERRNSMVQPARGNQRLNFGATQRPNGINYNSQLNAYQGPQVQDRGQPYQLINTVPINTVYLQSAPSVPFVSGSQMPVSQPIFRGHQVLVAPQIMEVPRIMGAQQIIGTQGMVAAPQMVSAPQMSATQQVPAAQQPAAAQQTVAVQATKPRAKKTVLSQSMPNVITQSAGNIPADKVIEMLKQMFTSTGSNNGARKFVIV